MPSINNKKGFTLVELLVVITIIGILAVGGLSLFASAQQKARDSVRQTDMRALIVTVEQLNLDGVGGDIDVNTGEGSACNGGFPLDASADLFADKITYYGYLDKVPEDPTSAGQFMYRYAAIDDCSGYELSVHFEHAANANKMSKKEDLGDDDIRYEKGTPGCIDADAECKVSPDNDGLDTTGDDTDLDPPTTTP
jgi:general secretion pathway protein G